ncbi:MAG: hypothetical protein KME55_32845 [Nostoc indistinguendum CM1-VF10]|jgi:hypothetical protein|nr:hypothetical protein [Nostoc indistinguendum CM1-VF10]
MELKSVYDGKLLNSSKVYQIDGAFYQYLHQSGSDSHPKYIFGHLPTPGHKKKANIVLNWTKLTIRCSEVVGMSCTSANEEKSEQMQLF